MSALDERLEEPWKDGGTMGTAARRARRRAKGLPNWKVSRYADDLVVLVHGSRADVEDLQHEVTEVLEPLGLRLSPAKTRIVHMSDAFDFLGFRIPGEFRLVAGGQVDADPASLEVEGRPPLAEGTQRELEADFGGRGRDVRYGSGAGYPLPLPLPRQQDPQSLGPCITTQNGRARGEPVVP